MSHADEVVWSHDVFTNHSIDLITQRAANQSNPFFLYLVADHTLCGFDPIGQRCCVLWCRHTQTRMREDGVAFLRVVHLCPVMVSTPTQPGPMLVCLVCWYYLVSAET
jgi:hypothetical protein